ncbi:hypothetical protein L873DRAFT_124254 [Choiromyces venosus 120613-1]|uniref:Uncharacterized protein n=1 Tax=Choiromyces venosus 120613-1 TaxID=1336337 RepID=A0A3N4J8B5_9PEZI|nr:hypothetical protein L873DRAFT_124254 [Choiromyces venosus 120613-1]
MIYIISAVASFPSSFLAFISEMKHFATSSLGRSLLSSKSRLAHGPRYTTYDIFTITTISYLPLPLVLSAYFRQTTLNLLQTWL